MSKYCENCGEKFYSRGCVNCNEVNYIEDQYHDLSMDVPDSIYDEQKRNRERDDTHVTNSWHREVLGLK